MNQPPANPQSAIRNPHSMLCPECGAEVKPTDATCWLCHASLVVQAEVIEPTSPPVVPDWVRRQRTASPLQFSLESLMLVITLIAVCLGMIVAVPGLGVLVSVVAAPALIRTLITGYQEKAAGHKLTMSEKMLAFLTSTAVALAVLATGGAAFGAACVASCFVVLGLDGSYGGGRWQEYLIYGLLGLSSLIGLASAAGMFWLLRPKRQA